MTSICMHRPCGCELGPGAFFERAGKEYCGSSCAVHDETGSAACDCGHATCVSSAKATRAAENLATSEGMPPLAPAKPPAGAPSGRTSAAEP